MIIYRNVPYHLQMRNIILLDDAESGGLIYVNKDTYDQALLLSGRLDGNPQRVLDIIKTPKTEIYRTMPGFKGLMENMMKTMPKPMNMLAPFMLFCVGNQGIEWKENDRIFAYGILHQLSQLMDFNSTTLVPSQMRAEVALPTALLMQYETSWNELCSSLEDKIVSITPEKSEDADTVTPEELRNTMNSVLEALKRIEDMKSQAPQIVYAQAPMDQQPVVQAPVQQHVVQTQPVSQPIPQPIVAEKPVEQKAEIVAEPVKEQTTVGQTKVEAATVAESTKSEEKSEDEQKADAVAAIIARMKAESEAKDKEKKDKLDKLTEGSSSKEDTTGSFHTDKRYGAEERNEINGVLDEYDF